MRRAEPTIRRDGQIPHRTGFKMGCGKSGFILTFTLGILLALTLLFVPLLGMPGNVRRQAMRVAEDVQKVYDAESSLLLLLEGLPHTAIPGLPPVTETALGPYGSLCASPDSSVEVCALTVSRLHSLGYREWHAGVQAYRESLREQILTSPALRRYSGNRRLFEAPGSTHLQVEDGDLRLHVPGSVTSLNVLVSGDVVVEGATQYDTLRIYATGQVTVKGNVRAAFLEVAAGERVEVSGAVRFCGMLSARREVRLRGRVIADYPSMAIAIGQNGTEVNVDAGVRFAGLRASFPGGAAEGDSVMPAFMEGRKLVFGRLVRR